MRYKAIEVTTKPDGQSAGWIVWDTKLDKAMGHHIHRESRQAEYVASVIEHLDDDEVTIRTGDMELDYYEEDGLIIEGSCMPEYVGLMDQETKNMLEELETPEKLDS